MAWNRARLGIARQSVARHGARPGIARHGRSCRGSARQSKERGSTWRGLAGLGAAWQGTWHGTFGQGAARLGGGRGEAGLCEAWQGVSRRVTWLCEARINKSTTHLPTPITKLKEYTMAEACVYRRGIPTEPDVNKLKEKFPDTNLKNNDIIPYQDIALIIGVAVSSSRFKTVMSVWRKYLEQTSNIILKPLKGQGYLVLSDSGKLNAAADKYKSAKKMAARAIIITTHINTSNLTQAEKDTMTKLQNNAGLMISSEAARRPLEIPKF